eukprot:comp23188_c1_seq1/m.37609 comp23188_c1_seq1/g.37609  ORF comp23188_c1_seq1/g.37609 comp23188_c1_seq1/m.37609 type:complete len:1156 (-) comp23188_c1_seq1:104-3571(-)
MLARHAFRAQARRLVSPARPLERLLRTITARAQPAAGSAVAQLGDCSDAAEHMSTSNAQAPLPIVSNTYLNARLGKWGVDIQEDAALPPADPQLSQERVKEGLLGENHRHADQRTQQLLSQIDVIIENSLQDGSGNLQAAEDIFKGLRDEGYRFDKKVYDHFMLGYAQAGNITKLNLFMSYLKQHHKPDLQNYSALLLCHASFKKGTPLTGSIEAIISEAEANGVALESILLQGHMPPALQAKVVDVIREVRPDFRPITPESYMQQAFDALKMEEAEGAHVPHYEGIEVATYKAGGKNVKNEADTLQQLVYSLEVLQKEGLSPIERQLELEARSLESALVAVRTTRKDMMEGGRVSLVQAAKILTAQWLPGLTEAIKTEQKRLGKRTTARNNLGCFLNALPADKLALITINCAFASLFKDMQGTAYGQASHELGSNVCETYALDKTMRRARELQDPEMKKIWQQAQRLYEKASQRQSTGQMRVFWKKLEEESPATFALLDRPDWPPIVQTKVGAALLNLLLNTAKINPKHPRKNEGELVPAFHHSMGFVQNKALGFIKPHDAVVELLSAQNNTWEMVAPKFLPMVAPPRPYTDFNKGGYFRSSKSIMRTAYHNQQVRLLELRKEALGDVLDCLNVLSSVPWRVNNPVLEVMTRVWNSGGDEKLGMPSMTNMLLPDRSGADGTLESKLEYGRARKEAEKVNAELHSRRSDMHYRLVVAYNYRNLPFYLPHNLDFRGRAYPIPPHLNHIGADTSRGLLLFDKARPLGKEGLYWLKVQLANLYGNDKVSLDERAQFIDQHIDDVIDAAERPLDGRGWWRHADSPFQALACCMELTQAWRSSNPEAFLSRLPVHQDGSCNGLQHYAALGGDILGAEQVNLMPSDKPQDVYQSVADGVCAIVAADAAQDHEMAKLLQGKITRKVVKQTVMTSVYGVTFIGAREQIRNRLKERGDIADEHISPASNYLALTVLHSLESLFTGAKEIQDWLAQSAQRIAQSGNPVHWVTPLQLPVVQHYSKRTSITVRTAKQALKVVDEASGPAVGKQRSAFPPNFVHSLDSTHMLLTARACSNHGLTFAAVHDSYWSHAADITRLSELLRDEFISMHGQPILENLVTHWRHFYHGVTYKDGGMEKPLIFDDVPKRGLINLEEIRKSKYFFD